MATTMLFTGVLAPDLFATALRQKLPVAGNAEKKEPKIFANPMVKISWFTLTNHCENKEKNKSNIIIFYWFVGFSIFFKYSFWNFINVKRKKQINTYFYNQKFDLDLKQLSNAP